MSELKSCPFCGNKLIKPSRQQLPELSAPAFWFRCACCGAESGPSKNHPEAITGWNSRAESPELDALREQVKVLREALENAADTASRLHKACLDPSRPRQAVGEMAGFLLDTLNAALEQTKSKDEAEDKL